MKENVKNVNYKRFVWCKEAIEKLQLEAQIGAETGGIRDGLGARNIKGSRPKLPALTNKRATWMHILIGTNGLPLSRSGTRVIVQSVWAPTHGKGLQVYSSMLLDDANYKKLTTALLQWYELTEDGFSRKFSENQPKVGETVKSWRNSVSVCRRFFTRWTGILMGTTLPSFIEMHWNSWRLEQLWSTLRFFLL